MPFVLSARRSSKRQVQPQVHAAPFEPLEGRRLMSLTPVGEPVRVNAPEDVFDFFADVDVDADGDSVVTWFHITEDWSDAYPVARLFDANGQPKGPQFRLTSPEQSVGNDVRVAMDDAGNFVVSYIADDSALYARLFDAAGTPRGPEFRVDDAVDGNPGLRGYPYIDLAAEDDGDFTVVWKHSDQANGGLIYARRYDAAGAAQGAAFRVDEPGGNAADAMDVQVAVNDKSELLVAWRRRANASFAPSDLYGRVFSDTNVPEGAPFLIDAGGDHSAPSVTATKNNFVVAWRDAEVVGGPQTVLAQRYNRHGVAQEGQVLVKEGLPGGGSNLYSGPWVDAAKDGRFAVAWSERAAQASQPGTVWLRQFDAEGAAETEPVYLATGADWNDGLYGFAADDDLAHGLAVWLNGNDFSIAGLFLADAGAPEGSADDEAPQSSATELLHA